MKIPCKLDLNLQKHGKQLLTTRRINHLDELWESACRLMEAHFKLDLPEKNLDNPTSWKRLRDSPLLDSHIHVPLPRTNTAPAKQMRIALTLAILARLIDKHIFQPCYLFSSDSELRDLLVRLAVSNSKKEAFVRGMLLGIEEEEQGRTVKERRETVVREVVWYVGDLLADGEGDGGRLEGFKTSLTDLVQRAAETWQLIQKSHVRYEPFFNLTHYDDLEWETLAFDGVTPHPTATPHPVGTSAPVPGPSTSTTIKFIDQRPRTPINGVSTPTRTASPSTPNPLTAGSTNDILLCIFPRLYIFEDNEPQPVTSGVVLRKWQALAAAQELDRTKTGSPRPPVARSTSKKPRQLSISLTGGGSGGESPVGGSGVDGK